MSADSADPSAPAPPAASRLWLVPVVLVLLAFPFVASSAVSRAFPAYAEFDLTLPALTVLVLKVSKLSLLFPLFIMVLIPLVLVGALVVEEARGKAVIFAAVAGIAGLVFVAHAIGLLLPFLTLHGPVG